jgi:hypothetical protein
MCLVIPVLCYTVPCVTHSILYFINFALGLNEVWLLCGEEHCDNACYSFTVSLDCDFGEYGTGCKQKCGHCANLSDCDKYTGECPFGCNEGYYPPLCQESELFSCNV